ncbi:MAG TPA: hypothetical protein VEZ40_17990 [Pyrinomonadaceae bacterium]|nr:hypothetical protein [Pyrinomonadaceae bacterium]
MPKLSDTHVVQTRWVIEIDRREVETSLDWARDFFARYDTSELTSIRIGRGRGRARGVYGRCWYPTAERPGYRISCQLPGPFPSRIPTRQPPIYRRADGSWPPLPAGCREGLSCRAEKDGVVREWKRVIGYTEARTSGEGLVWIVAHEAFHFLRHSRQISGRNTEIEADRFADEQLRLLLRLRERWSGRA